MIQPDKRHLLRPAPMPPPPPLPPAPVDRASMERRRAEMRQAMMAKWDGTRFVYSAEAAALRGMKE